MGKHGGGRRHSSRIQSIVAGHTGYGNTIGGELPQYAVAEDAAHVETGGVMAEVTGLRGASIDVRVWG